jgi:hypothetical protein
MIELLSQKKYDSIRSGLLRNIDMINNLVMEGVNYCYYGSGTRPVAKESLDYAFKIANALD